MSISSSDLAAASAKHHPLSSEPLFEQAQQRVKEKNLEGAIEFFSELVQSIVQRYGDQSIESAPAWFEYGNALLLKEEENPSDDLLGAAAAEARKAAKVLGEELGDGAVSLTYILQGNFFAVFLFLAVVDWECSATVQCILFYFITLVTFCDDQ